VIPDGSFTTGQVNFTNYGTRAIGSTLVSDFTIQNVGTGPLTVTAINFLGTTASDFTLVGAPTFPWVIQPATAQKMSIQFKPSAEGPRDAQVNITSDDTDESLYDFIIAGVGQTVAGVASKNSNFSSLKLYPNPTGDAATVEITLTKDMQVVVSVTDLQGKMVLPAVENNCKAGEQKINLNTSSLANGTYYVQVACNGVITKTKLVVTR
jgi:hypothetical protein